MNREEMKRRLEQVIDERRQVYLDLGRKIYENPETGYREIKTTKTLADALEALGYRTERGIAYTGCRAHANEEKKGPKIAVIGELDALLCPSHPDCDKETGAMHACGHNVQTTVMYGAADALKHAGILDELDGQIDFMAVPAEEVIELDYREALKKEGKIHYYSGKTELIAKGAFDDVDICMMVHNFPFDQPGIKMAPYTSSNGFVQKHTVFMGKQSHAGQAPWDGINALNMASLAISAMHYQRETFKDADTVRVHQIITKGGDVVNSVPARVELETTIRANNMEALMDANKKVNRSIRAGAVALGGRAEVMDSPGQLPIVPDKNLAQVFRENALRFYREEEMLPKMQWTASSDMGDVSSLMPALHGLTGGIQGGLHTADYRIVDEEDAYLIPIKVMAFTLVDLLADGAAEAARVIREFKPVMTKDEYMQYLKEIERTYIEE